MAGRAMLCRRLCFSIDNYVSWRQCYHRRRNYLRGAQRVPTGDAG